MSDTNKHHPDRTPVFGLDDLEGSATSFNKTGGGAVVGTAEPEPVEGVGPSIALHDKLSGVRVVTDKFPVEIGNGRRFDMALRGPGPDGLYARIEQDAGGLAIECCHQRVFLAVDMTEATRHRLIGPASIQLGDHLISFDFADQAPAKTRRKRPKWAILVIAAALVVGLFLLRWLLVADEAESRVTVVKPPSEQVPTDAVDALPVPGAQTSELAPIVKRQAQAEPEISEPEPEPFQPAPLAVFFSTTRALPLTADPEMAGPPEPMGSTKSGPATPGPQGRQTVSRSAPAPIVQRYQRGEPIMMSDASPALKQALVAIRDFYDSATVMTQMKAWETLVAAEDQLGLEEPSARREQIRAALGGALSSAAAEQAELDNALLAYGYYYHAAELGHGNDEGSNFMAALDNKAARLYRFGYQLKYADPSTAGAYWARVMEAVPSQSEWHRKARLALNQSKGVRG